MLIDPNSESPRSSFIVSVYIGKGEKKQQQKPSINIQIYLLGRSFDTTYDIRDGPNFMNGLARFNVDQANTQISTHQNQQIVILEAVSCSSRRF
jgi:hypothetical protein